MSDFNLLSLLGLAALSGVVAAIINLTAAALAAGRANKRHARHLALELAVLFEAYANRAASAAFDIDAWEGSWGSIGRQSASIVPLPALPEGPDAWRNLEDRLRDQAMSFGNAITEEIAAVEFAHDVEGTHDGADTTAMKAHLRLAREAFDLAVELRRRYKWKRPLRSESTAAKVRKSLAEQEAKDEEHRQRNALAWAEMMGSSDSQKAVDDR